MGTSIHKSYELSMDHTSFTTRAHEAPPRRLVKDCSSTLTTVVEVPRQAKGPGAAEGGLRLAYPKNASRTSKGHICCDAVSLFGVHGGVCKCTDAFDLWMDEGIAGQVANLITFSTYLPLRDRLAEHPDEIVKMIDQLSDGMCQQLYGRKS